MDRIKLVSDVLGILDTDFAKNLDVIFTSNSDKAAYKSLFFNNIRSNYQQNNVCFFSGCRERAIRRSHVIQKSGPLKEIQERGHVMEFCISSDMTPEVREIGIKNASVFPGFCKYHENSLFSNYERNKYINDAKDVAMQSFRGIAWAIHRKNSEISAMKALLNRDLDRRISYIEGRISEKIPDHVFVNRKKSSYINNDLLRIINQNLIDTENLIRFKEKVERYLFLNGPCPKYAIINLHCKIPATFSGACGFKFQKGEKISNNKMCLNLLPEKETTKVCLMYDGYDADVISHYASIFFSGLLTALSTIETWMLLHTDKWFIKPSAWNKIPDHRKKDIIQMTAWSREGLFRTENTSIFDDIRINLIDDYKKSAEYVENLKENELFLSREIGKIY